MNFKIKSAIAEYEGKISLQGVKKPIEFLGGELIRMKLILVCDSTFYLNIGNQLTAISDRELSGIIRTLIDAPSRAAISSSAVKEASEKLRDMPEVQIDIDKIIEKNKYKVLVKNGFFNVKNGTSIQIFQKMNYIFTGSMSIM